MKLLYQILKEVTQSHATQLTRAPYAKLADILILSCHYNSSGERPLLPEPTQLPRPSTSGISRIWNCRHSLSVIVALVIVVVVAHLLL